MKTFLLLLSLTFFSAIHAQQQFGDFKHSNDTLFIQDKMFLPGDTLHLGFGSGANKQFLFIAQQTSNMKKYVTNQPALPYQFANSYLIYKRIEVVNKKQAGIKMNFVEPIFGTSLQDERLEWMISFTNAIKTGEILL